MIGQRWLFAALVFASFAAWSCDRQWQRRPKHLVKSHAIAFPSAQSVQLDRLGGRAVDDSGKAFLIYCLGTTASRGIDVSEAAYEEARQGGELPFPLDEVRGWAMPTLVELDAKTRVARQVDWSRWHEATGPLLERQKAVPGVFVTDYAATFKGAPLVSAAPYVKSVGRLPGDTNDWVVFSAFGPLDTRHPFLGEPSTWVMGDTVIEWVKGGDVTAADRPAVHLIGSGTLSSGEDWGDYLWSSDGRYCIYVRGTMLWVVESPHR